MTRSRMSIGTQEPTRYEVVVTNDRLPNTPPMVLGFTARVGREGLVGMIRSFGDALLALCVDEDAPVTIKGGATRCRVTLGGNLTVHFSGRTEREVASEVALS